MFVNPKGPEENVVPHMRAADAWPSFTDWSTPLTTLPPLSPNIPLSFMPPTNIEIPDFSQDIEKNQNKVPEVKSSIDGLFKFAKNHPFLTAGLLLGIGSLILSFIFFASALSGVTGITILHCNLSIGIGLGVMFLYYGISLINLAVTAKQKDDLHAKITELEISFAAQREELFEAKKNQQADVTLSVDTKLYDELQEQITAQAFQHLPEGIRYQAQSAAAELASIIEYGTENIPGLAEAFKTDITIPEEIKEGAENRTKLEYIKQGLHFLYESIGGIKNLPSIMAENPKAASLVILGLVICLLAIPAAYFFLSGSSSVLLFGALSTSGVTLFLIYGISIIYEGYCIYQAKKLQRKYEEIRRQRDLERQENTNNAKVLSEKIAAENARRVKAQELAVEALGAITNEFREMVANLGRQMGERVNDPMNGAETLAKSL